LITKNNIHFDKISSTNEYALSIKNHFLFKEGLIISTNFQNNGKGQYGNSWHSEFAKNLLISIVIYPNISNKKKFDLNKIASLAVCELLCYFGLKAKVKWPNDIIVNNKKICGILIENIISNKIIKKSVIGFGININQTKFKKYNIPATSFKILKQKSYKVKKIKKGLVNYFFNNLYLYRKGNFDNNKYNDLIYSLNIKRNYLIGDKIVEGIIKEIDHTGNLIISFSGEKKIFKEKEISYIF
tara:strand:- start:446 stop:1171 length:726 start_codon:yes stop_codon:yes gene_type:complete